MSAVVLVWLKFGLSCWWDFMGVASDTTRRCSTLTNSPILWFLRSFRSLLPQCFLNSRCTICGVDVSSIGIGLHKSTFWLIVLFCSGLHLSQREVSLLRGKGYIRPARHWWSLWEAWEGWVVGSHAEVSFGCLQVKFLFCNTLASILLNVLWNQDS